MGDFRFISVMMVQTKCKLNNTELFLKLFSLETVLYSEQRNWKQKVLQRKQRELEKLIESFPEYISDRIRKNMAAGFHLAGDSKLRGGSVKPGSGGWPSPWAICWWLAGGQLSKAGGRGGCLVHTPPLS